MRLSTQSSRSSTQRSRGRSPWADEFNSPRRAWTTVYPGPSELSDTVNRKSETSSPCRLALLAFIPPAAEQLLLALVGPRVMGNGGGVTRSSSKEHARYGQS